MIYKKIRLLIIILTTIFSFQNDTLAQNSIGLELICKPAVRKGTGLFTPQLGVLVNYGLDEKDKHRVGTGVYADILTFTDSSYYYLPSIEKIVNTNFRFSDYFITIPIRYSYHIKGFYAEGGLNGSFIVATRLWAGSEKEAIERERSAHPPFMLEYHLGLGYKYSYKKFDFRLGISSDIYSKLTYTDVGIDIGVNYKIK